jgi:hypothetical protein
MPPEIPGPAPILVGFHGYAENAEAQLERLSGIPESTRWLSISCIPVGLVLTSGFCPGKEGRFARLDCFLSNFNRAIVTGMETALQHSCTDGGFHASEAGDDEKCDLVPPGK